MKEARYFFVPDAAHQTELPADEAMHALRVLRLKGGDEIFLMDGVGNYYRAQVTIAATHHCYYEILEHLPQEPEWTGHLHLAIGLSRQSALSPGKEDKDIDKSVYWRPDEGCE